MGYLALDIGTTNWKAVVFSEDFRLLYSAKRPTRCVTGEDGLPYYDPGQVWDAIVQMIGQIGANYPLNELKAVSVTSMGEAVVPLGRDGMPAFSIIPWFDTRSYSQAQEIRKKIGAETIFDITGSDTGAIFSLPKMLWMRDHHPEIFESSVKWLQMTDYINYRLCGRIVTDYSMACRTLAFDLRNCVWSEQMLRPFGLQPDLFPEVTPSGTVIGNVTAEASAQTGLPAGLCVVMGGHDHPVASIAGCAFQKNVVFDSSGTAEPFMHISAPREPLNEKLLGQRRSRHPLPDRFINWGGIVSSGACVDWAVARFASHHDFSAEQMKKSYNELFNSAASLPPGSGGLMFHPSLRGSGAPLWDSRSKGSLLGLTSEHSGCHILRAVLEGLCYQGRRLVTMHEEISGCRIDTIRCMGGGARISLWQQIKADVTGCQVEAGRVTDATPMGAAILCGHAFNASSTLEELAALAQPGYITYEPDQEAHRRYRDYYEVYLQSCEDLERTNHALDALRNRDLEENNENRYHD